MVNREKTKIFTMFLTLNHQKLDVYTASRQLVKECYLFAKTLPDSERFGMISQLKRAALSAHLNISEGASRKSAPERKRYYEVARESVVEIDAVFDIANDLGLMEKYDTTNLSKAVITSFKILSGLLK